MRLESARRSYDPFLMAGGILVLGAIVAISMKGYTWIYELIPISIVIFISGSNTFTMVVTLTDDKLEIEYFQYFRKKVIAFDVRHLVLNLERHVMNVPRRKLSRIYYVLQVYENGSLKYVINSQEGFSENGMVELVNKHNALRSQRKNKIP